jgi:toxin-antitoxin system PIN domain toxin
MQLVDVNVFVYAHREDAEDHVRYRAWLETMLASDRAFGFSDLVLSGFLRIVTHPKVFLRPTPLDVALEYVRAIRSRANAIPIVAGSRHWSIFENLCREVQAKGNLLPDAYFAALSIESGSEWISTDRDYARFPGLKWRHPLR